MPLELYERPGCYYCAKVRRKLDELGLEYDAHQVPAARSRRETVEAISGQTGVPVLADPDHGVEGLAESDDIVEYLERTYGAESPA